MSISQKGAVYEHQAEIERRDVILGKALAHLASQIQAVRSQGNFGERGNPSPPSAPAQLHVVASGGLFTVRILHNNPPVGCRYRLQYDTSPNFPNPIETELATTSWERYLPNRQLYFRVAAKFLASPQTPWLYFGPASNPTVIG